VTLLSVNLNMFPISNIKKFFFQENWKKQGYIIISAEELWIVCPDYFSMSELQSMLKEKREKMSNMDTIADRSIHGILLLAKSNYEVIFESESPLSQRILFPKGPTEIKGIEDARFVMFQNEDLSYTYYATYTAYDGSYHHAPVVGNRRFYSF
jgi:hypothetical protein